MRHRARRRWTDERIWREFFCACIPLIPGRFGISEAATLADEAYAEYRERFPVREPELNDETDTETEAGSSRTEKEPLQ
jgi:hypothetical protein